MKMLVPSNRHPNQVSFENKEMFLKVGNILHYFSREIDDLYIRKLFKLLYILDELSIREIGMPVTGLDYEVARNGPLALDVWTSIRYRGGHFDDFVTVTSGSTWVKIEPNKKHYFDDSYFTEFEIELLSKVVLEFGFMKPEELIDYTHREGSPWDYTAKKYEIDFSEEDPDISGFSVEFSPLLNSDLKQRNFDSFMGSLSF